MSRPFLLLAAVLALAPRPAGACKECGKPAAEPGATIRADPSPSALFRPSAPGALDADETVWLAQTEAGRFVLRPAVVTDTLAQDPSEHALTNSQVQSLLARHSAERVRILRVKASEGPLSPEDRGTAVTLFWNRGPLLSKDDQDFLRGLITPALGKPRGPPEPGERGVSGLDGPDRVGLTPAAAAPAEIAAATDALLKQVTLDDRGDPKQNAALREAFANMMQSPTAREMARQFIAEGATVKVHFGPVDDSQVVTENGRKVLQASGGNSSTHLRPIEVLLNQDYLDTDPDYRRTAMSATLAHEMFGHSFETLRAEKQGVTTSLNHYRGDEAGSGLLGWTVEAELGGRLHNGHMWNYLGDPEAYHKNLQTTMSYYAGTLSRAEMRDPVGTLRGRKAAVAVARQDAKDSAARMARWTPIIEHFVSAHKKTASDFESLREDIVSSQKWSASALKELDEIEKYMQQLIDHWTSPAGKKHLDEIVADADKPYYAEAEARLSSRVDYLRTLVGQRKRESTTPPIPGQVTWSELHDLVDQDRKDNPGHWNKDGMPKGAKKK